MTEMIFIDCKTKNKNLFYWNKFLLKVTIDYIEMSKNSNGNFLILGYEYWEGMKNAAVPEYLQSNFRFDDNMITYRKFQNWRLMWHSMRSQIFKLNLRKYFDVHIHTICVPTIRRCNFCRNSKMGCGYYVP